MNPREEQREVLRAQLAHWSMAIDRLQDLEDVASPKGWAGLERQTGTVLRAVLRSAVRNLAAGATSLQHQLDFGDPEQTARALQRLRIAYLRTETTLDFYADAIATRSTIRNAALLRATDRIAETCMRRILDQVQRPTPPVVTYIDKGLGASILKAGMRLWDRSSVNPCVAVKIVRHNLLSCTALCHEVGHQVSYMLDWNDELRQALAADLPTPVAEVWSSWASEIGADAVAFASTGYAAVSALRNVVDGGPRMVFRFLPGDPHPISYLRVLLGAEMAKQWYGSEGPWRALARTWTRQYPIDSAPDELREFLRASVPALPAVAQITLRQRFAAFGQHALSDLVDPRQVSPSALDRFWQRGGSSLYRQPHVAHRDSLKLVALSGHRLATQPRDGAAILGDQLQSMLILGQYRHAA